MSLCRFRPRRWLRLRRLLLLLNRRLTRRSLLHLLIRSWLTLPRRAHNPILHRKLLHELPLHHSQMVLLLLRLKRLELRVLQHIPPCRCEMSLLLQRERELWWRSGWLLLLWLLLLHLLLSAWTGWWWRRHHALRARRVCWTRLELRTYGRTSHPKRLLDGLWLLAGLSELTDELAHLPHLPHLPHLTHLAHRHLSLHLPILPLSLALPRRTKLPHRLPARHGLHGRLNLPRVPLRLAVRPTRSCHLLEHGHLGGVHPAKGHAAVGRAELLLLLLLLLILLRRRAGVARRWKVGRHGGVGVGVGVGGEVEERMKMSARASASASAKGKAGVKGGRQEGARALGVLGARELGRAYSLKADKMGGTLPSDMSWCQVLFTMLPARRGGVMSRSTHSWTRWRGCSDEPSVQAELPPRVPQSGDVEARLSRKSRPVEATLADRRVFLARVGIAF